MADIKAPLVTVRQWMTVSARLADEKRGEPGLLAAIREAEDLKAQLPKATRLALDPVYWGDETLRGAMARGHDADPWSMVMSFLDLVAATVAPTAFDVPYPSNHITLIDNYGEGVLGPVFDILDAAEIKRVWVRLSRLNSAGKTLYAPLDTKSPAFEEATYDFDAREGDRHAVPVTVIDTDGEAIEALMELTEERRAMAIRALRGAPLVPAPITEAVAGAA